jgi:uncharacterized membrane protein
MDYFVVGEFDIHNPEAPNREGSGIRVPEATVTIELVNYVAAVPIAKKSFKTDPVLAELDLVKEPWALMPSHAQFKVTVQYSKGTIKVSKAGYGSVKVSALLKWTKHLVIPDDECGEISPLSIGFFRK